MGDYTLRSLEREHARLRDDLERLRSWSEANRIFGGLWFDSDAARAGTGQVMIGLATTADPEVVRARIESLVEHPDRVRIVRCRWTYRELLDLRDRLGREMEEHPPGRGTYISSCGINERLNMVEIGISTDDQRFAQDVLDRYGAERVHIKMGVRNVAFSQHETP